jgi:hypothetical protein
LSRVCSDWLPSRPGGALVQREGGKVARIRRLERLRSFVSELPFHDLSLETEK